MGIILGIDIGGSTTKIVGYRENGVLIGMLQVRAADQITSLYGAVGNFTASHKIPLSDVVKMIITGVGASFIEEDIYGIPTVKVDEFYAIGTGGLALSGKKRAIVVSMGTGTAYVRADGTQITHIGGSGVGGGTLLGLSQQILHENNYDMLNQLTQNGNLLNVDLTIQDICKNTITSLPPHATASNFGKIKNTASQSDIALGLVNMVFQTIGLLAAFACRNDTIRDVVLVGSLATLPQAREIFDGVAALYQIHFTIPRDAVFATAMGAALPFVSQKE